MKRYESVAYCLEQYLNAGQATTKKILALPWSTHCLVFSNGQSRQPIFAPYSAKSAFSMLRDSLMVFGMELLDFGLGCLLPAAISHSF